MMNLKDFWDYYALPTFIVILAISGPVYIGWSQLQNHEQKIQLGAYDQGIKDCSNTILKTLSACQTIPAQFDNKTRTIVAYECLKVHP